MTFITAGMTKVQIVTTDKKILLIVGTLNQITSVPAPNPNQNLNQSVCFYIPFLSNYPLSYSQRGLVEPISFDSIQAEKRGVDPTELVGKVFANAYHIPVKPEDGLPPSYGIAFTDGSRYLTCPHPQWTGVWRFIM